MNNLRTIIKFLIGWPLSIVALVFIVKLILPSLPYIGKHILDCNWITLAISVVLFILYFLTRAIFWQQLLTYKGHPFSLRETAFLWGVSEIKRYLPGNIWALVGRTTSFSKKDVAKTTTIAAYVLEAEFVTLSLLFVSLFSLPFTIYSLLPSFAYKAFLFYGTIIITILFITFWIYSKDIFKKLTTLPFIRHIIIPFPPLTSLKLLGTMSLSFLFFGLATYASIASFFYIPPHQLFIIASFFVFALLVGYVSFITPMGLGVREGVITLGLSKFMLLTLAGFAAIFTRVIFTLSELLFLALVYFWEHTKNKFILQIEIKIQQYWHEIVLITFSLSYAIYFTVASCMRYVNYYTGRFDLGNMDQTVWNTIHGRIFQLTDPNGITIVSRLAFHADFILIILAPFYWLWQDPRMLLIIQTLVLTFGGIFVYLIAKEILHNKTLAVALAISFFINPSLNNTNLYDFHGVVLATTFFLAAWYFILKKKPIWYIIFLLLAGTTKEEVWFVVGLVGLYLFFYQKVRKIGIVITALGFILFWYILSKAIPQAAGGSQFALAYVADFGATPASIIKNIIFSPIKTFSILIEKNRLLYLSQLLLPVGFLSLLAPLQLIFLLPDLIINMLSSNGQLHQIYFQYTAIITPFLFISTIYGIKFVIKRFSKISFQTIALYILFTAIVGAWLFGPLPGAYGPNLDMFFKPQPDRAIIDNFLADIPAQFSIAATNNLGSHLSHRQKIYTIPTGIDKADIILFLLNDPFAQPSLKAQKEMAQNMKKDKNYIEIFRQDDFVVFEKRDLYLHEEPNMTRTKLFPFSILTLSSRDFNEGKISIVKLLDKNQFFTSYDITYPSDGLTIHALMQIPNGVVPKQGFPVVIVDHGHIIAKDYDLETSYSAVTSYFASKGFLVIKPDYRNNGNSDKETESSYVVAYPIDVLNLLSSLSTISQANTHAVFLWGHSVGAEVTLATIEAHDQNDNFTTQITASVLWNPVIDPYKGYVQLHSLFPNETVPFSTFAKNIGSTTTNPLVWESVSPLYYLDNIASPFIIRQGISDPIIPYQWSIELYDDAKSLGLPVSLYLYPGEDHTFSKQTQQILNADVQYFKSFLK